MAYSGVAIATCCHHRCTWRAYVNRPFLFALGIQSNDFHLLTRVSGWWVSDIATRNARRHTPLSDDSDQSPLPTDLPTDLIGLSVPEREELGLMAKRLLDWGRASFLRAHGFDSGLCHYVACSVTRENTLLIGTPASAERVSHDEI